MNGYRHRRAAGLRLGVLADSLSQAPPDCAHGKRGNRKTLRRALAVLLLGTGTFAFAADSDNLYQAHTDEELSAIAADWQTLTTEERRDYFIEVRRRMAEAGKRRAELPGLPRVVGERRFGRIIPQPDGSVLHIEGVVRYRDGETTEAEAPPGYGTGFEQRVEQSSATAPVVRVVSEKDVGQAEITETDPETTTSKHGSENGGRAQGRE